MDERGRSFTARGQFYTVKSGESICKISCPICFFPCFSNHIPGSCLSITCMECGTQYMGVAKNIKCNECESRLKCIGLQPVAFEAVPKNSIPINERRYNQMVPTSLLETANSILKSAHIGITVTKKK